MKYACLIYSDESDPNINPPSDTDAFLQMMADYRAFGDEAGQAGVIQGGEALAGVTSATSVQLRNGEIVATDGPFAETKEQLGGFYLLECETLDDAIKWAAKIPHAATGTIEVRPVLDFD
jgi:hypothetical protein